MAKKEEYPAWKKMLWRAGRAFGAGFLSSAGVLLIVTPPETFTSKESLFNWLIPLGTGALAGGMVGLGKFLRDMFPQSEVLKKMPL